MSQHDRASRAGCLTPGQARGVYNRIGRLQDLQALYEHRAIATLIAWGDFERAQSVFELGYGTGALAKRLLTEALAADARYTGVDVSPRMHELAMRRLEGIGHVELQLSDGSLRFPFGDAVFDRFVAVYVLDLLSPEDIGLVLAEAHRLLADDGLLCLASLTEGATPPARLLTRIWRALWSLRPALVGGCRPITITDYLDRTSWSIRQQTRITTLAVTSEVVVAIKSPRADVRRSEQPSIAASPAVDASSHRQPRATWRPHPRVLRRRRRVTIRFLRPRALRMREPVNRVTGLSI